MAAASNHRLQVLRQENARMQEKLAAGASGQPGQVLPHRGAVAMTEAEAHRYIEKNAMDTRRDRAEIAQEILDSYDPSGDNCVVCLSGCGLTQRAPLHRESDLYQTSIRGGYL